MSISESNILSFIDGYLTCALWASTDILDDEYVNLDDYEFAPGEAEKLHADCREFIAANAADLLKYADEREYDPSHGDVWEYAGHDFWLTRNSHGAGFWDRGLGKLGQRLTDASKGYGFINLYLGEDELVYLMFG